jgi:amidohydrolase
MLGMAKVMAEHKGDWGGTLILVGQPAEELITGAKAMIDDGFYDRHNVPVPDFFIGMHTAPGPVGMAACAGGVRMAGTEQLDVVIHGVGGHGSMPHLTKDPIMMAVAAATDYQIMLARTIDPQETAVLTIGSIQAGTDNNVIPESALLKLNLRYFNPAVREHMLKGINAIDNAVAQAYGMPDDLMPTVTLKGGSPPLVNTTALTERLAAPLKQLLGDDKVVTDFPPATGSEDCHLLMGDHKDIPFAFLIVGVADPQVFADARKQGKFLPYSAHNPNYVVDLAAIPVGAKAASVTVLELLAKV